MTFMDKLTFWKKGDSIDSLKPIGEGIEGHGRGPPPGFGESGSDLGLGTDRTAGLGGTGDIGNEPGFESKPISGGTPPYSEHDADVSISGQSYEKPPEAGDLRHAPLAPMDKPAVADSTGIGQSRDLEIISAKIDAIKANVESINHRLETIERILMTQEKKRVQW